MGKFVLLFPGQGAQTVGMGSELLAAHPSFLGDLYQKANDIAGFDLKRVALEGPIETLSTTAMSQPAIYLTSVAALSVLEKTDPDAYSSAVSAAGLSLGEYTALVFAGAISFEDGLRLVLKRGAAMQAASDLSAGGMVSPLGLDAATVETLCARASEGEPLKIANYLCPGNIVVSGAKSACERLVPLAAEAGAMKVVPLAVAGAFHTELMSPAADALRETLDSVEIRRPRLPVISNVDCRAHFEPDDIRKTLLTQLTSPVRWEESMRTLLADGCDEFYEIGPGRVLRGLMKRIDRKVKISGL